MFVFSRVGGFVCPSVCVGKEVINIKIETADEKLHNAESVCVCVCVALSLHFL